MTNIRVKKKSKSCRSRQSGITAITAVILVVFLALLGTYAVTTSNIVSLNTTTSVGGMQAWFAARAGVERAVVGVLASGCAGVPATPIALSGGGFQNFSITTLSCSASAVTEGPDNYNVYQITSTARRGTPGDVTYVSRTINISVTDF